MLTILALALASPASAADPLASAATGMVQCYVPDEQKKTCQSIGAYRRIDRTTYANTAVV